MLKAMAYKTTFSSALFSIRVASFCMLVAVFTLTLFNNAHAAQEVYPNKYAAFVMDADTGLILYQKNANKRLHPASLTKMMTLLMLFDAIDNGKIRMHSRITMSKHAASMVPSKLGLAPGETIKVEDAIYALVTKSANDVAVAVAEKIGGSEERFANMMTKKARILGMSKTRFRNASGLHDPKQVSSARDMGRLGRIMVKDYSRYYHYFSAKTFTYKGKTYRGHNRLMDTYPGMDGLKTGYISASGFNLVSSAKINNRRLVGVVFGGKTSKSRNARMEKLLDLGFRRIGEVNIAVSSVPIPTRKPITNTELAAIINSNNTDNGASSEAATDPKKSTNWTRWAMLDAMADNSVFNRMIGEGDYDSSIRSRIETGLIAVSSIMGEKIPSYVFDAEVSSAPIAPSIPPIKKNALYSPSAQDSWTIQVGAFSSRSRTNQALSKTFSKLPLSLKNGKATIAPKQTRSGWIYRARIAGYTKIAANEACKILSDCLVLQPVKP
jgi:D-alanyl-D-alanine carboxypeptidase